MHSAKRITALLALLIITAISILNTIQIELRAEEEVPGAEAVLLEETESELPEEETEEETAYEEPVYEEPEAEPVTEAEEEPVYEEPVTEPVTEEAVTEPEPVYEEPVTEMVTEPVYEEPVTEPATEAVTEAATQTEPEPVSEEPVTEPQETAPVMETAEDEPSSEEAKQPEEEPEQETAKEEPAENLEEEERESVSFYTYGVKGYFYSGDIEEDAKFLKKLGSIFREEDIRAAFDLAYEMQRYGYQKQTIVVKDIIPETKDDRLFHMVDRAYVEYLQEKNEEEKLLYKKDIINPDGFEETVYLEPLEYEYTEATRALTFQVQSLSPFVLVKEIREEEFTEIRIEGPQDLELEEATGTKEKTEAESEDIEPETEETSEEEATTEEETTQAERIRDVYIYEDDCIRVTATLQYASAMPDDAELYVQPVYAETKGYDYDAYLNALNNGAQGEAYTPGNTVLYDISFRILHTGENGDVSYEEYEPEEGSVNMQLVFKNNQLTEDLNAQNRDNVQVHHFTQEEGSEGSVFVNAVEADVTLGDTDNVEFTAESFSVYAFSYQVDMFYNVAGREYAYSFTGGCYIPLSDVVAALLLDELAPQGSGEDTVQAFLNQVADVSFSKEDLIFTGRTDKDVTVAAWLEENSLSPIYSSDMSDDDIEAMLAREIPAGTWHLISLAPFSTEETLTVTSAAGEAVSFCVTDNQITERVISSDGTKYLITATYGYETGIPQDAKLSVTEILPDDENYITYLEDSIRAADLKEDGPAYARIFDIEIRDSENNPVNPEEGTFVHIEAKLDDMEEEAKLSVVHFGDEPQVLPSVTDGNVTSFDAGSFSVYSLVSSTDYQSSHYALDTDELESSGFYMYMAPQNAARRYYFTNEIVDSMKIKKTAVNDLESASLWFFEKEPQTGLYRMYTYDDNDEKIYAVMTPSGNNGNMSFSTSPGTLFHVELYTAGREGKFYIYLEANNKKYGLNQFNGENGNGFAGWHQKDVNCTIELLYQPEEGGRDPFHIDGRTYGLANYKSGNSSAAAMMAEQMPNGTNLVAVEMATRVNTLELDDTLYVASDIDITQWRFRHIEDHNYYLTTVVGGVPKYLRITENAVTMADVPDEYCVLTLEGGTGNYEGKIRISNKDNYALNLYSGKAANGFGSWNDRGVNEWLNLVLPSALTEEDFYPYVAKKVSIADTTHVHNGSQVLVYTRVWDPAKLKYNYYVINHDGRLQPAYESGDEIRWIGLQANNAIWNFTEYYYEGTETPNYYYELQNDYSGKYLAPVMDSGSVLSDTPVGINLNGRRYGDYYSNILAWDDAHYDYAGYTMQSGELTVGPFAEAIDFYFAILDPDTGVLTTADTVEHTQYGISMVMTDYNGVKHGSNNYLDRTQTDIIGDTGNTAGLVTNYLVNGYPQSTITGLSLAPLFENGTTANHLFLESVYDETGYFEYNSTKNFAHLNPDGTFTVYNQLGTIDKPNQKSLDHGQFMPYNTISNDDFSSIYTNQTNIVDAALAGDDPRKGEALYRIPWNTPSDPNDADYHFGMMMTATFVQTANGKDNWGHDIIYEFAGDDDMWFYVDGELVLDLGGLHAAMTGDINFSTGQVHVGARTSSGTSIPAYTTSLYNVFKANYEERNPQASQAEVLAYLDEIFELNDNSQYVFKDYTTHEMKMFYMERGAGASNLNMRFNLTSVKPGTVVLNKTISGTDKTDYTFAEFPYQFYYREDGSSEWKLLQDDTNGFPVTYNGTNIPVKYAQSYTPNGKTDSYDSVFFLKPGQSAAIAVPQDTIEYYIVECGIDPTIYDVVTINNAVNSGTDANNDGAFDYQSNIAQVTDRPLVHYDNHINPNKIRTLTVTKRLYAEDGQTEITSEDDPQTFDFRLYLGTETESTLSPAYMQTYHVKDPDGNYCIYSGGFVSTGKNSYDSLTAAEKARASFTTSPNGAISRIPAGYSIEVRDLIVGTRFMIEERSSEIPKGYKFMEYYRVNGSYIIEDGDTVNSGLIRDNSNPNVEVHNKRGFSITVNKVWSDSYFTQSHGDVYFAVFLDGAATPLPGTVRRLSHPDTSMEFYFDDLEPGMDFSDYAVKEVVLVNPVNALGSDLVISYDSLTVLDNGDRQPIAALETGSVTEETFSYEASYTVGTPTGSTETIRNRRTDTVKNTRDGLKFIKTDPSGNAVQGAVFTLTDENSVPVSAPQYQTDGEGLILNAYFADGDYILEETAAPSGYLGLSGPVGLHYENGQVTFTGIASDLAQIEFDDTDGAVVTVTNIPQVFRAVKMDAEEEEPLEGVHFALYRQISLSGGGVRKDYRPISGYEDIVSGADGLIIDHMELLPVGTYYLSETEPVQGYQDLSGDICFSIDRKGQITVEPGAGWTLDSETIGQTLVKTLTIGNLKRNDVYSIMVSKTVTGSMGSKTKEFAFTLDLVGLDPECEISMTKNSVTQILAAGATHHAFTLKHGEDIIFSGIPEDTVYTITETEANQNGYVTTVSGVPSGFLASDIIVRYTNDRSAVIPTDTDTNIFTLAVVMGVVMAASGIGYILIKKKRKNEK